MILLRDDNDDDDDDDDGADNDGSRRWAEAVAVAGVCERAVKASVGAAEAARREAKTSPLRFS